MKPDRTGPFKLLVHARDPHTQPAGVRACPPFLPHDVWRLPGESLVQLVHRAKGIAVGQGVACTWLFYPDEVAH